LADIWSVDDKLLNLSVYLNAILVNVSVLWVQETLVHLYTKFTGIFLLFDLLYKKEQRSLSC